jgi:hypothetical protein
MPKRFLLPTACPDRMAPQHQSRANNRNGAPDLQLCRESHNSVGYGEAREDLAFSLLLRSPARSDWLAISITRPKTTSNIKYLCIFKWSAKKGKTKQEAGMASLLHDNKSPGWFRRWRAGVQFHLQFYRLSCLRTRPDWTSLVNR